ncbi:MAG: TIM barrel protein [Verrucomicrobia bacterium]|jgi:L-ribulose-5-phosphate 3-epimerase|nr:TIM barrel protein [Verrucomicrobiota bacterium]
MSDLVMQSGSEGTISRRRFIQRGSIAMAGGVVATSLSTWGQSSSKPGIELGVHHYSVRTLFKSGELTLATFPSFARNKWGVSNIELAEELCGELVGSKTLAAEIRANGERAGVRVLTLLCSGATSLDGDSEGEREKAVTHHLKWIAIARSLNCRFVRIRAGKEGDPKDRMKKAVAGIQLLCSRLQPSDPRPLIENVTALSRRPEWLVSLVKQVGVDRCGLLADYGNFEGDVYEGMSQILPLSESICTKSWDFDAQGNETKIDFARMGGLIKKVGFKGCISMEYLGQNLGDLEGVKKTARLVRKYL